MSDAQTRQLLREALEDEAGFVRAELRLRENERGWKRVVLRPVTLKGARHIQFSYFSARQDVSKNHRLPAALEALDEALELPLASAQIERGGERLQVQVSRKARAILHREKLETAAGGAQPHDRAKRLLLPAGEPNPLLHALGIMTAEGRVRAEMQAKFAQINEFLKLLVETGELEKVERSPLEIVDCGCGSAYLTLAVQDTLNRVLGIPARMTGVDSNAGLLAQRAAQVEALGLSGQVSFVVARIRDYRPAVPPEVVIALHACDTATDEALAQGLRWNSRLILAAPCCHRHLQAQLERAPAPPPFQLMLKQGVFKERLGDLLTDHLRVLFLRMRGYRADIAEFVSTEHTGKNLLIRAVRSGRADPRAAEEYAALKDFWGVRPYLEELV